VGLCGHPQQVKKTSSFLHNQSNLHKVCFSPEKKIKGQFLASQMKSACINIQAACQRELQSL